MRKSIYGAVSGLALAAFATPGLAAFTPSLDATVGAGACGGSISCTSTIDDPESPANNSTVADAAVASYLMDGSYATAHATATLGKLHVYSTAFRATGSDAQSSAEADAYDDIPGAQILGGSYTASFSLTGSHSDVETIFGNSALVYFQWQYDDDVNGQDLDNGIWSSSDAMPQGTVSDTFAVPAGHGLDAHVRITTFTYSSFGVVDTVDYYDTLKYYLTSVAPGPDLIGVSGHDYAIPTVSAVPEPASWGLMFAGLGLTGGALRRRAAPRFSL